jgi:hypothetical protein
VGLIWSGDLAQAGQLDGKKPDQPLDPLRGEFIKYILSRDGQTQTEKGGFYSVTNDIRETDTASTSE